MKMTQRAAVALAAMLVAAQAHAQGTFSGIQSPGQVQNSRTNALPGWTATPTLGVAGTTLGTITFSGNTSGTTVLRPTGAASGTLTLPAATDTLVGKATTDVLTNKTLTSPLLTNVSAPGTPASGFVTLYADSTFKNVNAKNDLNTIVTMVAPDAGASNNFLTGITTAGVITKAQPAFTNLSGSLACSQMPALTGDVTTSNCAATLANIPNDAPAVGDILFTNITAPTQPAAGKIRIYGDSSAANFQMKNSSGTVATMVVPDAGAANQWINSISTAGVPGKAQPACANLSTATAYCSAAIGQLPGTSTNDSASAGNIGQYIESVVPSGSAVSLVSTTYANMTSISLTAGDWDVTAVFEFTGGATTTVNFLFGSISTTSNTVDLTNGRVVGTVYSGSPTVFNIGSPIGSSLPPRRFSFSGTTTVYAPASCSFAVSTCSVYGTLSARRVR